jgi:long-chain acyl-CoA synthetase
LGSEPQTLRDHLSAQARRYERKTFLEAGGERYSFRAVDEWTDRAATGLGRLGLVRGDRVALVLESRPELLFLAWGAPKVGVVPALLDPALPAADLVEALVGLRPSAIVIEPRLAGAAAAAARRCPQPVRVLEARGGGLGPELETRGVLDFWPDLGAGDAALILFTRGRGGKPKPVVLTHLNLLSNARQMLQPLRIQASDRFYAALSLASAPGLVLQGLVPWAAGAGTILAPEEPPAALFAALARSGASVLAGTPDLYRAAGEQRAAEGCDLGVLRLAICGPGPVSAEVHAQFQERFDALIVEGYGLTEATCLCCVNPYTGVRKPGSLGLPLPGQECRVVGPDGEDRAAGQVGEIVVRGPNLMKEYFDDPAGTRRVLRDGWLHTGDAAWVDEDGYYHLSPSGEAAR